MDTFLLFQLHFTTRVKILIDDAIINDKISYYQQYAPISIASLEYFTGSDYCVKHNIKDNLGNLHNNVTYPKSIGGWYTLHNTNVYKINKQYSKLTGLWFLCYENRNYYGGKLEIYGDGVILFSGNMEPGIEPISLNIDISGVSELKIDFESGGTGEETHSGIADFTVQK